MPLLCSLQPEHVLELVQQPRSTMHAIAVQAQHAALDARDVEQAVDQAGQVLGAAADDAHRIARTVRTRARSSSCA